MKSYGAARRVHAAQSVKSCGADAAQSEKSCGAGFMLPNEQAVMEELMASSTGNKYFVPLVWAAALVTRARKEGRVKDDFAVKTLIDVSSTECSPL